LGVGLTGAAGPLLVAATIVLFDPSAPNGAELHRVEIPVTIAR